MLNCMQIRGLSDRRSLDVSGSNLSISLAERSGKPRDRAREVLLCQVHV